MTESCIVSSDGPEGPSPRQPLLRGFDETIERTETFNASGHTVTPHNPLLTNFASLSGRIGILGGTFDPPHRAHLAIACAAMAELKLDALVFIPAQQNPLKANTPTASASDRLAMLTAMLQSEPGLYVSPIELNRTGASYTIDTLTEIHEQLTSDSRIFLLAGADILGSLHRWRSAHKIPELATLVIMPRAGYTQQIESPLPHTAMTGEHLPRLDLSSTQIRAALASGEVPSEIPLSVQDYIIKHQLYQIT